MRARRISTTNSHTWIVDVYSFSVVLRFRRCATKRFGLARLEGYGGGWIASLWIDPHGRSQHGTRPQSSAITDLGSRRSMT